jgi:5-(carboxyamino)imidazole ribonucleotide mutase
MGSSSDWDTMQHAVQILQQFGIAHEAQVVSAHRMPDDMFAYAQAAAGRGLRAIIAGAGGAAHLPGMLAAKTTVPVLGVPVASKHLSGRGFAAQHRADAQGHSGGHLRHWATQGRPMQRCLRWPCWPMKMRRCAASWKRRQTEAARAMTLPPA